MPPEKNIDPEGFYGLDDQKHKPDDDSILHEDLVKTNALLIATVKILKDLQMQPTISINVEYEIEKGKIVRAGMSRVLEKGETTEDGHEKLYTTCLNSILRLV